MFLKTLKIYFPNWRHANSTSYFTGHSWSGEELILKPGSSARMNVESYCPKWRSSSILRCSSNEWQIGTESAVLGTLNWSIVLKRNKPVDQYLSVHVPSLTDGHELWVRLKGQECKVWECLGIPPEELVEMSVAFPLRLPPLRQTSTRKMKAKAQCWTLLFMRQTSSQHINPNCQCTFLEWDQMVKTTQNTSQNINLTTTVFSYIYCYSHLFIQTRYYDLSRPHKMMMF